MDIEDLKAFTVVADTESFSLAAQKLFITQPAVSKRIAALEQNLDHSLFDRLGKRVELTEAGKVLLPQALTILKNIEETTRSIRELTGEISGSLKVATSHHIGLHHLPPVLRSFASQHPDVNLLFDFLDSEKAYDKVINGDVELAIVTLAPKLEPPLEKKALWKDPLVFVAGQNHPLSRCRNVTLEQLSEEPAILPDLNTFTGRLAKSCFDNQELELRLNMTTNYLETIRMMVSVGLGWSFLPKTLVNADMRELKVKGIALYRTLGVITHKKRTLSNAANAFFNILTEH